MEINRSKKIFYNSPPPARKSRFSLANVILGKSIPFLLEIKMERTLTLGSSQEIECKSQANPLENQMRSI